MPTEISTFLLAALMHLKCRRCGPGVLHWPAWYTIFKGGRAVGLRQSSRSVCVITRGKDTGLFPEKRARTSAYLWLDLCILRFALARKSSPPLIHDSPQPLGCGSDSQLTIKPCRSFS